MLSFLDDSSYLVVQCNTAEKFKLVSIVFLW